MLKLNKFLQLKGFLIFLLLILYVEKLKAQIDTYPLNEASYYEKCRRLVLKEKNRKIVYHFKVEKQDSIYSFNMKYLGSIRIKRVGLVHFINYRYHYSFFKGNSRGDGLLYLYNSKHILIGCYRVGGSNLLPSKIEKKSIVFIYKNKYCNETTKISFKDSIPNQIFVKCKGDYGDFYGFGWK